MHISESLMGTELGASEGFFSTSRSNELEDDTI